MNNIETLDEHQKEAIAAMKKKDLRRFMWWTLLALGVGFLQGAVIELTRRIVNNT